MRGGKSVAHLIFDDHPIGNPVINHADILLRLSWKGGLFSADKIISEEGLDGEVEIPFRRFGLDRFGREIFGNMIAIGVLISELRIGVSDGILSNILPIKFREDNLKALNFGLGLRERMGQEYANLSIG